MPETLGPGGWFVLYLLIAMAGTWWARRYSIDHALIDLPGERRSHRIATPRGGGVSIVVAMLLALVWLAWDGGESQLLYIAAVVGLVLVAGVGWLDDHRPQSPWFRLAVHFLAAIVMALAIWWVTANPLFTLLALVAVPVLVNAWNFMDGIDGLAVTQAAIAASAYALYSADAGTSALAWALAAACSGFLPFNFPKARIFLGDVGSGALGFMLAVLLVWNGMRMEPALNSWLPLLLPLAALLIDAALTLLARMVRGERWWTAHVEHAYQRLSARLGAHWPATLLYAVWSICGSMILLIGRERGESINIWLATAWLATGVLVWAGLQAWLGREATQG